VEAALIALVSMIVNLISIVLILHALMSFAPIEPWHPVRRFLDRIAEPIIRPFRGLIPPVGMFDFSIMVAIIAIQILGALLTEFIRRSF
jgi:YggT family protein